MHVMGMNSSACVWYKAFSSILSEHQEKKFHFQSAGKCSESVLVWWFNHPATRFYTGNQFTLKLAFYNRKVSQSPFNCQFFLKELHCKTGAYPSWQSFDLKVFNIWSSCGEVKTISHAEEEISSTSLLRNTFTHLSCASRTHKQDSISWNTGTLREIPPIHT